MSELLSSPLSSHETPTDELIVDAPSPVGERIPLPNGTTLERPNLD